MQFKGTNKDIKTVGRELRARYILEGSVRKFQDNLRIAVQLIDVDPAKQEIAKALGVEFSTPEDALGECDLVVHASATEAGLARSLELLATEGEVIELSWYGDHWIGVPLGEHFHSRRLTIRSSQVGMVSPARRSRRDYADRLSVALRLLADPAFDALVTAECRFEDLPSVLPRLAGNELSALCLRVLYEPHDDRR